MPVEWLEGFSIIENERGVHTETYTMYYDKVTFKAIGDKYRPYKDDAGNIAWGYSGETWHTVTTEINYRSVDTELGAKCKEFAKVAKENGLNFSQYQFSDLMKVFNVSVK